jgi:RNA polymerase-binding protein DksA
MARAAAPKNASKPAAPASAVRKVTVAAKKAAPAKVTATKKPPVKKAVAAKQTAPARGVPAKKAPVKAVAPAKKAPPVKKAPVKKVAPAKKAPVKKAVPAKAVVKAEPAKKAPRKPTTVICPLSGFEVKPEKPGLSPKTIERLQASLVAERARHVQQADELAAEAEQLANEREGGDTQFDEESGEGDTLSVERERDLALSTAARQTVEEIEKALARMEDGTYGYCEICGDRIPVPRLEAIPWADQCVKCKSRGERRR